MPSWDIFEHQTEGYRDTVMPPHVIARVAIEQASTFGWERYVGRRGCVVGMKTFGASAPLKELQRKFGFEPDQVVTVAKDLLVKNQRSPASQQREFLMHPNRAFVRWQNKPKKDEALRWEQRFCQMEQILAFIQSTRQQSNCFFLIVLMMRGPSV